MRGTGREPRHAHVGSDGALPLVLAHEPAPARHPADLGRRMPRCHVLAGRTGVPGQPAELHVRGRVAPVRGGRRDGVVGAPAHGAGHGGGEGPAPRPRGADARRHRRPSGAPTTRIRRWLPTTTTWLASRRRTRPSGGSDEQIASTERRDGEGRPVLRGDPSSRSCTGEDVTRGGSPHDQQPLAGPADDRLCAPGRRGRRRPRRSMRSAARCGPAPRRSSSTCTRRRTGDSSSATMRPSTGPRTGPARSAT